MVDWTAKQLPSVSSLTSVFRITPEFTKEAVLTKLVPSQGTLEPEFDPYIQEYSLQVGPEVEQILFELEAADGGNCKSKQKEFRKTKVLRHSLLLLLHLQIKRIKANIQ